MDKSGCRFGQGCIDKAHILLEKITILLKLIKLEKILCDFWRRVKRTEKLDFSLQTDPEAI